MKKYCAFFAIILGFMVVAKAQITEINGISKKSKKEAVKLFRVVYGRMEEIASVNPAANGAFNFKFKPDYKGFYVVGFGDVNHGIQDKFKLYVKGNDKINLILNDSSYILTGSNTKENQVLEQWYKLAYKLERKTIYFSRGNRSFSEFFSELENVVAKSKNWTAGKETGNSDFDQLIKNTINYDLGCFTLTLLLYPSAAKPGPEDYTSYVKSFNADQFIQDDELLKFPYGTTMLVNLISFKNMDLDYDFDKNLLSIPNDKLKGEYLLSYATITNSYPQYKDMIDKFGKYLLTNDQKVRAQAIENNLAAYKTGAKAINFTYPNALGKEVSLTDFKGKIVLVDVWATWCGPCNKEIPYLKALEKEFHNKDVVFLGVSVDDDKDKWKKFVATEQLGGVQVFTKGRKTQITNAYKIGGIPRFMLFDKNGNIIDIDVPRPSDPKLKEILKEWLNKSL